MPILSPEPSMFPENLFQESEIRGPAHRHWQVLHTKPRQEKALVRQLIGTGIPCYLPQHSRPRLLQGRKVRALVPLFPSYVFLFGNPEERLSALQTNRVVQIIQVENQQKLWTELFQIQRLIDAQVPLSPEGRLQPGRRVRIRTGVLRGVEGTLVARRGEERLIISIDFLQQGASIAIDDFMIEVLT